MWGNMKLFFQMVAVSLFFVGTLVGLWIPFAHPELTDTQLMLEYPLHFPVGPEQGVAHVSGANRDVQ